MDDGTPILFEISTAGTALVGAALEIVEIPGRARCLQCSEDLELDDQIALCTCGSANLSFISGQEPKLNEVEVSSSV